MASYEGNDSLSRNAEFGLLLQGLVYRAIAPTQPETLTPFRYLVEEGPGLSTKGWTLALEKSTYDFTSPRRPTRLLERDVLEGVAGTDPAIRAAHDEGDHGDGYCALLRRGVFPRSRPAGSH